MQGPAINDLVHGNSESSLHSIADRNMV